jgi:hypothetical protein
LRAGLSARRRTVEDMAEESTEQRADQAVEADSDQSESAHVGGIKLSEVFARSTQLNEQMARMQKTAADAMLGEGLASVAEAARAAGARAFSESEIRLPEVQRAHFELPEIEPIDLADLQQPQLDLLRQLVDAQTAQAEVLGRLHEHQVESDRAAQVAATAAAKRERLGLVLSGFAVVFAALACVLVIA